MPKASLLRSRCLLSAGRRTSAVRSPTQWRRPDGEIGVQDKSALRELDEQERQAFYTRVLKGIEGTLSKGLSGIVDFIATISKPFAVVLNVGWILNALYSASEDLAAEAFDYTPALVNIAIFLYQAYSQLSVARRKRDRAEAKARATQASLSVFDLPAALRRVASNRVGGAGSKLGEAMTAEELRKERRFDDAVLLEYLAYGELLSEARIAEACKSCRMRKTQTVTRSTRTQLSNN